MPEPTSEARICAILENLQEQIRQHRETLGGLGVFGPPADPLAAVRERQRVNSHLPIGWPVMPKGIMPKMVAYAQKITRRLLRWYIVPLVDQQNAYNAAVTEVLGNMLGELNRLYARVDTLEAAVATLEEGLATEARAGHERDDALQEHLEGLLQSRQLDALGAHVAQLQGHADREDAWLRDLERRLLEVGRARQGHEETVRLRLQRLENWYRDAEKEPSWSPSSSSALLERRSHGSFDYYLLGARYRNEVQMAVRLGDYDDLFQRLKEAQDEGSLPPGPVLDLGAGRGELVAHLAGLGLSVYGVDMDRDAVAAAQAAGRDVRLEEGAAHLMGLADGSLAAVAMIQVIEHLDVEALLGLLRLCRRKLMPGGLLLAETINPTCLWALSNWYLLDPSHKTPLHPEMVRFLLEQAGFAEIEVRYLHPLAPEDRLALAERDETTRRNVEQLNRFLYGPQDYAAIGIAEPQLGFQTAPGEE